MTSIWDHDGYLKMETKPPPHGRNRPASREKKIPGTTDNPDKASVEPPTSSHSGRPVSISESREERDHIPRHIDRSERPAAGNRGDMLRGGRPSRERYGGGNYREEGDSVRGKVTAQVSCKERNGSMISLMMLTGVQPPRTKRIKLRKIEDSFLAS